MVGALVASTVVLACMVPWLMVLHAPMSGMPGAPGMAGMSHPTSAVVATPAVAARMAAEVEESAASTCDTPCVAGTGDVCALAVGLNVTITALVLALRRNTLFGLLERLRRKDTAPGRPTRLRPPWTVPPLARLCVLRV